MGKTKEGEVGEEESKFRAKGGGTLSCRKLVPIT